MYESLITPPTEATPTTSGGSPGTGNVLDRALQAEGVSGQLAAIARSVYQQESGSGSNTRTSNAGAVGGMQIIPSTFRSVADSGWDINNPDQNARAGVRYLKQRYEQAGGDPVLTAAGYYGGPDGLDKARRGIAVADPRNPNAPNTLQYGQQVAGRIGGAGGIGHPATAAPAESETPYYTPVKGRYSSLITPPQTGATMGDYAKELGASAVDAVGAIGQFAGEGAANLANQSSGTQDYEGKNILKPVTNKLRDSMSEGGKRAGQEANVEGSVLDLLSGDVKLPGSVDGWLMMGLNGLGSMLPMLVPGAGLASKAAGAAKLAEEATLIAKASGLAVDIAKAEQLTRAAQAASMTGKVVGGTLEASMTGGAAAGDVRDTAAKTVASMSHQDLMAGVPAYAEVFSKTGDEDQARKAVVNSSALWAAGLSGLAGAAGGVFNAKVLEDFLVHKGVSSIVGNAATSRLGRGAISGAGMALAEGGQEVSEKVGQNAGENIGLGRSAETDVMRNTAGDFLGGALVGGPLGTVGGLHARRPAADANTPAAIIDPAAALAQHQSTISTVAAAATPGNSALTRAAVTGNTGAAADAEFLAGHAQQQAGVQAEQQAAQQAAAPAPVAVDPLAERVQAIKAGAADHGILDALRADHSPIQAKAFVNDLAIAQSASTRPDLREQALSRLEYAASWAAANPAASVASGIEQNVESQTAATPTATTATTNSATADKLPPVNLAASALLRGQDLSSTERQTLTQSLATADNPSLPVETRRAARTVANEIMGRRATTLTDGASNEGKAPALFAPKAPVEDAIKPIAAKAQPVTANTANQPINSATPKVAIPVGEGSAQLRKRRATLAQLIADGLNTVERRHDGQFYLVNANRKRQFKLEGPADAQLARKAVHDAITAAANQANTSPTEAQAESGNYKKGRVDFDGLSIGIENPVGSERSGTAPNGAKWAVTMTAHYGDLTGTTGADGDGVDVYLVAKPRAGSPVFVVDQYDGTKFDEHKAIIGVATEAEALAVYDAHFSDGSGPRRRQAVTAMSATEFKAWAQSPAATQPTGKTNGTTGPIADTQGDAGPSANAPLTAASLAASESADGSADVRRDGRDQPRAAAAVPGVPADDSASATTGHVTVQVDGKPYQVTLVEPLAANDASPPRANGARRISKANSAVLQKMAGLLGKKIQFFSDKTLGDGFVDPATPATIYINEHSTINPMAVFGHEFTHTLKVAMPEVYASLMKVVGARVNKQDGAHKFRNDYYKANEGPNSNQALKGNELEELTSDIGGDLMGDISFWADVFKQVESDQPATAKSAIAKLAAKLYQQLDKLIDGIKQRGFGSAKLVSDMTAVRNAFKGALAKHIVDNQLSQASMQAAVLKESQAVKREEVAQSSAKAQDKTQSNPPAAQAPQAQAAIETVATETPAFTADARQAAVRAGFDTKTWYHGTTARDFKTFKSGKSGVNELGEGIYFTSQPEYAQAWAGRPGMGGRIIPVLIKKGELFDLDQPVDRLALAQKIKANNPVSPGEVQAAEIRRDKSVTEWTPEESRLVNDHSSEPWRSWLLESDQDLADNTRRGELNVWLSRAGYIGATKKNSQIPGQVVVFDAKNIRSPLAKFNTKNAESANILASSERIPGATLRNGTLTVPTDSQAAANDEMARIGSSVRFSAERASDSAAAEYAAVEAKYKGTAQWMQAPDGQASKLNERQWVHVRTPAFKSWFGDFEKAHAEGGVWTSSEPVSKAVSENGEPAVVYHGSDAGGFTEFTRPGGERRGDLGIFTSTKWSTASSYVTKGRANAMDLSVPVGSQEDLENVGFEFTELDDGRIELIDSDGNDVNGPADSGYRFASMADAVAKANQVAKPEEAPGVYALFVNLRNPGDEHFEGALWTGEREDQFSVNLTTDEEPFTTPDGRRMFSIEEADRIAAENDGDVVPAQSHWGNTDDAVREARRDKHDGAIIRQVVDDGPGNGRYEESDLFVAFNPNQLKSADFNGGSYSVASDDVRFSKPRDQADKPGKTVGDLSSVAERGERVLGKRVSISADEQQAIKDAAIALKTKEKTVLDTVRKHKLAHPASQGWAPVVFTGAKFDDKGKPEYNYEAVPYTFNADAKGTAMKPGSKGYQSRLKAIAKAMRDEVRRVYDRSLNGDKNAQNILAQAAWYKAMRSRLRQEFGGLGDLFADLLGATSPNTPVRDNWSNAVDSLRRAMRGDYDQLIPQWEAWADKVDALELEFRGYFNEQLALGQTKKAIKELPEYQSRREELSAARKLPAELLPAKESGKLYGFNGRNVARAMVDLWRVVRDADADIGRGATAPKALNFSGNLIGFRDRATIDVWAARHLQRLSGGKRIASMAEKGVSGDMRSDGSTTLQFGFGQDAFTAAAALVRSDPEMRSEQVLTAMNDDDLQAVVWFVEKELWTINNWTSVAGEGGSFEMEANLSGSSDQAAIKALRKTMDSKRSTPQAREQARSALVALERTVDRFVGGLSTQMSMDNQGVDFVPTDSDMARLGEEIRTSIYEDDDGATVLGSKALSTQGRYGAIERSLDLEVVARQGYQPAALWKKMLETAREAKQDSIFLSRVLRENETIDPLVHRPGVEIYFREAVSGEQMEQLLDKLAKENVEFLTVITDGRRMPGSVAGGMPPAVGVRMQYVPEFEQRYGMDELASLSDDALRAKVLAKADEMRDLAARVSQEFGEVTFAGRFWHDTQVAFSHEYEEKINAAITTGPAQERRSGTASKVWSGQSIRQGLESANRQHREAAIGQSDGVVLGRDAAGTGDIKHSPDRSQGIAGQPDGQDDARANGQAVRRPDVDHPLKDGRGFTGFFSNISLGFKGKPGAKAYTPVLDVTPIAGFVREYNQHRGNFDDHIASSIPGFRELQTIVGSAIAKSYRNADMLDIGASEGALIKTITKLSNGQVRTLALDPNFAMARHFNEGERIKGANYDTSAFGSRAEEGQDAWTEGDSLIDRDGQETPNPFAGQAVKYFQPKTKYDVVHEAMVFQFISGDRATQVARTKELMEPDGVLILEQKFVAGDGLSESRFRANEAQKDAYKEQYFTKAEIAAKAKAVGVAEKAEFEAGQQAKETAAVGMNDLMVAPAALEAVLGENFKHVRQFWDSGNFKGYVASDSQAALDKLLGNMLDTNSEFSTAETPRQVTAQTSGTASQQPVESGAAQQERASAARRDLIALRKRESILNSIKKCLG